MRLVQRLLLALPLALLGAGILVRSLLARPQTETDKWLWEQGERTPSLFVIFKLNTASPVNAQTLTITDRQGIRALLRAFKGASSFVSHVPLTRQDLALISTHPLMSFNFPAHGTPSYLSLVKGKQGYILLRGSKPLLFAHSSPVAVTRAIQALQQAQAKARRHEEGYVLQVLESAPSLRSSSRALTRPTR